MHSLQVEKCTMGILQTCALGASNFLGSPLVQWNHATFPHCILLVNTGRSKPHTTPAVISHRVVSDEQQVPDRRYSDAIAHTSHNPNLEAS